ncbi:MAG: prepilin peptidase, partial [Streptomyces sp.]
MTQLLVLVAALWGAAAGSLLPRAAYRYSVPTGQPWRTTCPDGHPLGGWLGRARCGTCGTRQSYGPGTLVLSTVTALVCAALAAATGTRPEIAVWLLLAPVGVLLAVIDLRVRRLPDPLTLPLAASALALLGAVSLVPEHTGNWLNALFGALTLGVGYWVLWRINPGGLGFGDVKLALGAGAVLGWYGWDTVLLGTFAGFLLG